MILTGLKVVVFFFKENFRRRRIFFKIFVISFGKHKVPAIYKLDQEMDLARESASVGRADLYIYFMPIIRNSGCGLYDSHTA